MKFVVGMDVEVADHDVDLMVSEGGSNEGGELAFFQVIADRFEGTAIHVKNIRVMRDDRE